MLVVGRPLRDWGAVAGDLRRSLKLYARGDRERSRRLLIDSMVRLRVPPSPLPSFGEALDLLEREPAPAHRLADAADIIVPVHNGTAHLRRLLASLFLHTDPRHRIVLADDGSTDPEIATILAEAATRPNVRLLTSPTNRGFVATVNRALNVTHAHAVILNSDTQVPAGWLERLLAPFAAGSRIASTTPFSNAATIFSFPVPDQDHDLPPGLGLAHIDRAFARLAPAAEKLETPTAIGYCMGINRAAWLSCGPFDEAAFGRGYCEETDWCLRAESIGWRHILVPNLFVYHAHGGTFANLERKALMEANLATLHRRWPGYYRQLTTFRRRDPWATCRAAALLALATAAEARPLVLGTGDEDRDVAIAGSAGRGTLRLQEGNRSGPTLVVVARGPWRTSLLAAGQNDVERLRDLLDTIRSARY
jgi:GT2 family glycosyltransferase